MLKRFHQLNPGVDVESLFVTGPQPEQFPQVRALFQKLLPQIQRGMNWKHMVTAVPQSAGSYEPDNTLQGWVVRAPMGYRGDFKIIDDIYTNKANSVTPYAQWDQFFQDSAAVKAVRNRKEFFKELICQLSKNREELAVLNVACGPCRDIAEVLHLQNKNRYTCVDHDARALEYARQLIGKQPRVELILGNALRLKYTSQFDLAWSAGLMDYFDDRGFRIILRSMFQAVKPGGHVVVGNFSTDNPDRGYMEWGEWVLIHRTKNELMQLAREALGSNINAYVEQEPEGVNLFLHVIKPASWS